MSYRDLIQALPRLGGPTPQSLPLPGQAPNNAGGHWYALDDWARLDRFLLLGSDSGTYYVSALALTRDNAGAVLRCLASDGPRAVRRIVALSDSGRAPENGPALFALALAAAADDPAVRRAALDALPQVARTGAHLLAFAAYVQSLRGWGRGLRRGVARWFAGQPVERLALQAVKYARREGWALRDLLRLAHPLTDEAERRALIDWIAHPEKPEAVAAARAVSPLVEGLCQVRAARSAAEAADAVLRYSLPREAVPTGLLDAREVWDALLVAMPLTAMLRNLGKMSAVGLVTAGSDAARYVAERLADAEALAAARVHPVRLLLALRTYAQGRGMLGRLAWTPAPAVIDALDDSFHRAFGQVAPTGRRLLVAVDVSGSMHGTSCAGSPVLTAMEAAAAVAMAFVRADREVELVAFDTAIHHPGVSPRQRLDDVVRTLGQWDGGTDVAQPVLWALERRLTVDGFVILTDDETWAGDEHPVQALARYREQVNPAARIAVLACAANAGSVVPADDPLAFGAAGFDAAVPELAAEFLRA